VKEGWQQRLRFLRPLPLIAVVRSADPMVAIAQADRYVSAGLTCLEVTWSTPDAAAIIRHLQQQYPHCTIGAATLRTTAMLDAALVAGAQFLVSPHTAVDFIPHAQAAHVPLILGALTPTEIVQAWQAGADAVKVFPVMALGGAAYVRMLRQPFPDIPLIPCGGIPWSEVIPLLRAGAIAIGMGSQLSQGLTPSELTTQVHQIRHECQQLGIGF